MTFVYILGIILEIATTVLGFIAAFLILKKNKKYLGNKLMATSMMCIGFYTFFILLYDLISTEQAIIIFYPIALTFIFIAPIFLFYTMHVMIDSSKWFNKPLNWIPYALWGLAFSLYININFERFLTILEIEETVNTGLSLTPLIILLTNDLIFLIWSIINTYKYGIKLMENKARKKKMKIFGLGLVTMLLAIFLNIPGQLIKNPQLGSIFDVLFFLAIFIGTLVFSVSFMQKVKQVK